MDWSVNERAPESLYLQLIQLVKYALATGELKPGDRLPPVRKMALRLRINPNTVAKAYRELELERLVETKAGSGVWIASTLPRSHREEQRRMAEEILQKAFLEAIRLGFSPEEAGELAAEILAKRRKSL